LDAIAEPEIGRANATVNYTTALATALGDTMPPLNRPILDGVERIHALLERRDRIEALHSGTALLHGELYEHNWTAGGLLMEARYVASFV